MSGYGCPGPHAWVSVNGLVTVLNCERCSERRRLLLDIPVTPEEDAAWEVMEREQERRAWMDSWWFE